MSEELSEQIVLTQKKTAIETFVSSLMPSARMTALYADGHPMIPQIAERSVQLLMRTLGQDTSLVVDIKGKSACVGEMALSDLKEIALLGSALHTLGIGQVLFANRLTTEGMMQFLKILLMKADEKNTLTAIQQEIQKVRIDGLQMAFVLSFVATGETEETSQKPGQLAEEQITAFLAAGTLPDFLYLLYKQNEPLNGKEAEALTALFEKALYREISLEQFQEMMPWHHYDPRIRSRWDYFAALQNGGTFRDRKTVLSRIALLTNSDLDVLSGRSSMEKTPAVLSCLKEVVHVLENPTDRDLSSRAVPAYGHLLFELGQDGNIKSLLEEFKKWKRTGPGGEPHPFFQTVCALMEKKVCSPTLIENLIIYMSALEEKSEEFEDLKNFIPPLGFNALPLLVEELRKLSDQQSRRKLCSLLTSVCKTWGDPKPLFKVLSDPDWFVVRNIIMVLAETGFPETSAKLAPLLNHKHERVREETIRSLGRIADPASVNALSAFVLKGSKHEEVQMAVTTLSLFVQPGIDKKLIEAYRKITHYNTRLAILTALSRVKTPDSKKFLETESKKTFVEMITGKNKSLRKTAKESLAQMGK